MITVGAPRPVLLFELFPEETGSPPASAIIPWETATMPLRLLLLTGLVVVLAGNLGPQARRVTIEIKPGDSGPKSIEPGRGGLLPIAILTTAEFDAAAADTSTIRLGPTGTEATAVRSMLEDVDRDGDLDRLVLVSVPDMRLTCAVTEIRLRARSTSGQALEGSTRVSMEGCGQE
jgi:hypothetical protein